MIIGAPIIGVTAFSGSMLLLPGPTVSMLHSIAMQAPLRIVTGTRCVWFDVPSSIRATWGTASPIKETGPQKAVIVAVRIPVHSNIEILALLTLMPRASFT